MLWSHIAKIFLDIVLALKLFSIPWVVNYGLQAKFDPPPVFVNKIYWERATLIHLHLQLLWSYRGRTE